MYFNQLQLDTATPSLAATSDPIVLCAADDNYVKPLAVTLFSAANSLRAGSRLNVLLMDGGLKESSWHGLKETFADVPIDIHVIRPDLNAVSDLMTSHHITKTAYLRLLAGKWLPESINKVIYLDSDVLVRGDLNELWEYELGDHYCLAVPDIACPHVDARLGNSNFKKSSPYLASLSPIQNWKELGLAPEGSYFNSGVMVLNIDRWRRENIETKLLSCLRNNAKFVWCWDQYALNVVFAGQWGKLPLRWNQGAHVFEFPDHDHLPVCPEQYREMLADPAIIHFTTEWKPWHYRPFHPLREAFYECLDQTAWKGWRPEKPDFSVKDEWTRFAVAFAKQFTIYYRKTRNFWR